MPRPNALTRPDPDDVFADTRMSFGDHIEELRSHLVRALVGLLVVVVGGFVLDAVGEAVGNRSVGVGRPMMGVIVDPVERMVRDFYAERNDAGRAKLLREGGGEPLSPAEEDDLRAMLDANKGSTEGFTEDQKRKLRAVPQALRVRLPVDQLAGAFGLPRDPSVASVELKVYVYPAELDHLAKRGETLLENKKYVTTLSAQEAMVVYVKVSLLCGAVLASPWILYQIWSFVAAGLYPTERAAVYRLFGPSVGLFLAGVLLCQFIVLPAAVQALIAFNRYLELDPDIRLNEWLGFALVLPLVFGVSFQTPLVMFFLNRIGTFSWQDYWSKWRYAVMVIALFSAVITPTPDAVTMMYLFVPMFALYMAGVLVCKYFPPAHEAALADDPADQVAV